MKPAQRIAVVLVTAPNLKTARALARAALDARLAACVNLVQGVESHYTWKGRRERASEVLLVMKSLRSRLARLEALITKRHPYDTPEVLALSSAEVNAGYLRWVMDSCAVAPSPSRLRRHAYEA
jgi:periplasmic divalent cation tolerance protein